MSGRASEAHRVLPCYYSVNNHAAPTVKNMTDCDSTVLVVEDDDAELNRLMGAYVSPLRLQVPLSTDGFPKRWMLPPAGPRHWCCWI